MERSGRIQREQGSEEDAGTGRALKEAEGTLPAGSFWKMYQGSALLKSLAAYWDSIRLQLEFALSCKL